MRRPHWVPLHEGLNLVAGRSLSALGIGDESERASGMRASDLEASLGDAAVDGRFNGRARCRAECDYSSLGSYSAGFFDPMFWREDKAVQAGLAFNSVEFDGIKSWVMKLFPNTQEFNRIAVAQPVSYEVVAAFRVLEPGDIGE